MITELPGITMLLMLVNDKTVKRKYQTIIFVRLRLKLASVSAEITDSVRLFHTVGPATMLCDTPHLTMGLSFRSVDIVPGDSIVLPRNSRFPMAES